MRDEQKEIFSSGEELLKDKMNEFIIYTTGCFNKNKRKIFVSIVFLSSGYHDENDLNNKQNICSSQCIYE